MKRDSVMLYRSHIDALRELSGDDVKASLIAISDYAMDGIAPECSGIVMAMFQMMKPVIDANNRKAAGRTNGNKTEQIGTNRNRLEQIGTNENKTEQIGTDENKSEQIGPKGERRNIKDIKEKESREKEPTRFAPPTVEEVREYAKENGYDVDADRFVDFYASKGWLVGKNKMKDWRAAVRNWSRSQRQGESADGKRQGMTAKGRNRFVNADQRDYDFDDLEKKLRGIT